MRLTTILAITWLTAGLITGCNNTSTKTSDTNDGLEITYVNPDDKSDVLFISEMFCDLELIPLETTENSLIGEISRILIHDEKIFILDEDVSESVLVFNMDGSFKYKISASGNGPNEYTSPPEDMFIDSDNNQLILITEDIMFFDADNGSFIKRIQPHTTGYISFIRQDVYAYYSFFTNYSSENQKYNLSIQNNDSTHRYLPIQNYLLNKDLVRPMFPFHSYNYNGDVFFTEKYNDTVYHITPDMLKPMRYIDFGKYKITESELSGIARADNTNNLKYMFMSGNSSYAGDISLYAETPYYYYFNYSYKGAVYDFLFNKSTGKTFHSNATHDDIAFSLLPGNFIFAGNKYLVSYMDVIDFKNEEFKAAFDAFKTDIRSGEYGDKTEYLKQRLEIYESKYKSVISNIEQRKSDEDNPVLVIYRLKIEETEA